MSEYETPTAPGSTFMQKLVRWFVFLSEDGPNEMGVACNYWGRWPFRCQTVIILIASVF